MAKQIEITNDQFPTYDQSTTAPDFLNIKINQGPKMGKVPEILRQNKDHEDSFRPLLMALGPYHHHGRKHGEGLKIQMMQEGEQRLINHAPPREKLKIRMVLEEEQKLNYKRGEELKIQLMQKFYKGEATSSSYQRDYEKVLAVSPEAKKCYSEDSTKDMNDDVFAKMMFLDGCAILQFISCAEKGDWSGVNIKNHEIALIIRDLFLLENQLPSFVLKTLIKGTQTNIKEKFEKFIKKTRQAPMRGKKRSSQNEDPQQASRSKREEEEEEEEPLHLLDSLWKYHRGQTVAENKTDNNDNWYTFRSIKELKYAGILASRSKTSKFTDIKYVPVPHHRLPIANLFLPPIVVDDSTKSILLNLASFEMSSDSTMISVVCPYICFMDSLIDHTEDVAELRRRRIILNRLGSDEKVARLFNDVAKHIVPDPGRFQQVMTKIEEHYRSGLKKWINEFLHTHFRRPWTVVVFLAAVAGLVMACIQTYAALVDLIKKAFWVAINYIPVWLSISRECFFFWITLEIFSHQSVHKI